MTNGKKKPKKDVSYTDQFNLRVTEKMRQDIDTLIDRNFPVTEYIRMNLEILVGKALTLTNKVFTKDAPKVTSDAHAKNNDQSQTEKSSQQ